jgi:hypothetical protein
MDSQKKKKIILAALLGGTTSAVQDINKDSFMPFSPYQMPSSLQGFQSFD